jgi:ferric-dicitrate binding protein FerR (iron transport regulator)
MTREATAILVAAALTLFPVLPANGQAVQPEPAGQVKARLPQGQIYRPAGSLFADPGTEVFWDDLVTTDRQGRMRIMLGDGSLLNIGSDSSLRILRHDKQSRQTNLTLTFGKLRSRLQSVDRNKGEQFTIRTNTAVLGVIGTDFYVEALATSTRVIVYEGLVFVRSIQPIITGVTLVGPGQKVFIHADQPPSAPEPAESAEMQRSIEETDVGESLEDSKAGIILPPPEGPSFWRRNKWLLVGIAAAAAAVAIAVPLASGGTRATGCPLPPLECPISPTGP